MEKYSAFRDPGTGIQPFLPPVPPPGSELLARTVLPLGLLLGTIRTVLILALLLAYTVLVHGLCLLLTPVPPLRRIISRFITAVIARLVLALVGLLWIPVEYVTRKRGRVSKTKQSWTPRSGDIIVSNWSSWLELIWLAFRFDPIFVLPISEAVKISSTSSQASTPITDIPGRRTGTGSANISPKRNCSVRVPIVGFQRVSLLSMLRLTGRVPPFDLTDRRARSLQEMQKDADRPIVVFPECTTSNGRGLLRFAHLFQNEAIPVRGYQVFIMCVRYDPPVALKPSLTHSMPSALNPLPHLFTLSSTVSLPAMSIRLLHPSESPSSPLFTASDFTTDFLSGDPLSETCATLIAQIGKMKKTGMGWEDKSAFLRFFREKQK